MRHIPIYLWKEWREHRAALGVMLGSLTFVTFMALTYFGWSVREAVGTFYWVPGLCGLGALLTVGSDLFSRDISAKHTQFLERVPASLSPSYWSKLIFFVAVIGGSVAFGILLCNITLWLTGAQNHSFTPQGMFLPGAAIVAALSFWVFANSSWSPTTVATVPGTLLIAGALLLPIWLISNHIYPKWNPTQPSYWALLPSTVVGAVVCGRICYGSIALRRKPKGIMALASVTIAAVSFLPVYAPLGADLIDWVNRPYRVQRVVIGSDPSVAFVQLNRKQHVHNRSARNTGQINSESTVFRLRLDDLSKDELAPGVLQRLPMQQYPWNGTLETERVGVINTTLSPDELRVVRAECEVYDTRSGEALPLDPMHGVFPFVKTGPHSSSFDFPEWTSVQKSGFGTRYIVDGPESPYQSYRLPEIARFTSASGESIEVPYRDSVDVRVLPHSFLKHVDEQWLFWDKTEHAFVATDAIQPTEEVCALLSDETVLLANLDGELFVADPRNGARQTISLLGDEGPRRGSRPQFMASHSPDRLPLDISEPLVVSIASEKRAQRGLGVIDFQALECRPYPGHHADQLSIVWSLGHEAFVVESGTRLVHVNLETGERRLLLNAEEF